MVTAFVEWEPALKRPSQLHCVFGGETVYNLKDLSSPDIVADSPFSPRSRPTTNYSRKNGKPCRFTGGKLSVIESYERWKPEDITLLETHSISHGDGETGLYDFVIGSPKAEPENASVRATPSLQKYNNLPDNRVIKC